MTIDTTNLSVTECARLYREEMIAKTLPHDGAPCASGRVSGESEKMFTTGRRVGGDYKFKSVSSAVPKSQVDMMNSVAVDGARYHESDPDGEIKAPVVTYDSVSARAAELNRRGLFDENGGDKDCKFGQSKLSTG